MQNRGLIFDIQHFAVHDGPGIRTLVFLKGCNFKCPWCENPEGIHHKQEIMFFPNRCIGDFECIDKCSRDAIEVVKKTEGGESNRIRILWDRCNDCLDCVSVCYPEAIRTAGKWMTVKEVLDEIGKDEIFYGDTGGVTLSGGEPTLQKDFIINLLRSCRKLGIDTAIETNGSMKNEEEFIKILNYVDHTLMDIKHMNTDIHREVIGYDNDITLRNFKLSVKNCPHVIARVPVIPDFNMNRMDILDIAAFVKESGGKEIHLLPYHSLGASKSENLGRPYKYHIKKSLKYKEVLPFKELIEKNYSMIVKVGG